MGDGVPLDDLLGVLQHFQVALRRMVEDLSGRQPQPGRMPDAIRSAGSLRLRRTRPGSLIAELELATPSAGELPDFGLEAVDRLLAGIDRPASLPVWVLREVQAMQESLHEGVDRVTFQGGSHGRRASLIRERALDIPARPMIAPARRRTSGRVLEVDWKDRTAELHGPSGVSRLSFAEELGSTFRELATRQVWVEGQANLTPHGVVRRIEVDSITAAGNDDRDFWTPFAVAILADLQGVRPCSSVTDEPLVPHAADDLIEAIFG